MTDWARVLQKLVHHANAEMKVIEKMCVRLKKFVTRYLIGFKFELNWPEDTFFCVLFRLNCVYCCYCHAVYNMNALKIERLLLFILSFSSIYSMRTQ